MLEVMRFIDLSKDYAQLSQSSVTRSSTPSCSQSRSWIVYLLAKFDGYITARCYAYGHDGRALLLAARAKSEEHGHRTNNLVRWM